MNETESAIIRIVKDKYILIEKEKINQEEFEALFSPAQ